MTDALAAFLKARIDDDERVARAATPGPWCDSGGYVTDIDEDGHSRVQVTDFGTQDEDSEGSGPQGQADSAHIARQDPARTLREVEAKRQLVDAHGRDHECISLSGSGDKSVVDGKPWAHWEPEHTADAERPCFVLRALTLPYADHPGYLEEWRP